MAPRRTLPLRRRPRSARRRPAPERHCRFARARLVAGVALVVLAAGSCSGSTTTTTIPTSSTTQPPAPTTTRAPFVVPGTGARLPDRSTREPGAPVGPAPDDYPGIVDAVGRATPFVVAHAKEIDGPTMYVIANVGLSYGHEDLSALRPGAEAKLAADPPLKDLVLYLTMPMWRRMAWPETAVTDAEVAALQSYDWYWRMQWPWVTAYTCGTPQFPTDWAQKVHDFLGQDDPEHYVATHAGIALATLAERGCTLPDWESLRDQVVTTLQKDVLTPFAANDVDIEAMVVLALLGRADLIQPAWVQSVLDAQQPDGSWAQSPPKATVPGPVGGHWHTTFLALWLLDTVAQPSVAGPFFT